MSALGAVLELPRKVGEGLLLRRAEARARTYAPEQSELVRRYHAAAARRLLAARDLRDSDGVPAAGTLYREAGTLAARAVLAGHAVAEVESLEPKAVWQSLRQLVTDGALAHVPASDFDPGGPLDQAAQLAESSDALELDDVAPITARDRLDAVDRALTLLLRDVEPRSVKQLARARVLRIAGLVLSVLALVGGGVAWALAPRNVARGKPVLAHSYWPGSPSADALVNGERESPWGSAASGVPDVWFRVDLQSPYRIDRVVVHNRKDQYAHTSTPLAVELSDDGENFTEVARFEGAAEEGQRWAYEGDGRTARYVRVKRIGGRGLALTEIEVFGQRR